MKISFVIPALDEEKKIGQAIEAAIASGAAEVIVVDGGSEDQTVSVALGHACKLLHADPGRASQMNCGANHATGDVLLFLHADTELPPRACQQIQTALSDGTEHWGGFEQVIDHPARIFRWIESGNAFRVRRQSLVYGDQAIFVRRSTFESVDGFPSVALMEDFALSQRLSSIARPLLLPGPVQVSARRWQKTGVVRQTIRNWMISLAYRLGVSPDRLARWYGA